MKEITEIKRDINNLLSNSLDTCIIINTEKENFRLSSKTVITAEWNEYTQNTYFDIYNLSRGKFVRQDLTNLTDVIKILKLDTIKYSIKKETKPISKDPFADFGYKI